MKILLLKLLAKLTVSGTVIINNTCKCKWGGQKGFVVECLSPHRPTSNKPLRHTELVSVSHKEK